MAFFNKVGTLLRNSISISVNNASNSQSSRYNAICNYATKKATKKATRKKAPRKSSEFKEKRSLRQFTLSKGKTAGRTSSGCITSFHRGGGAKRSQRIIDLKRNTSSMGVVERIEYDPNRSTRIALVRWKGVAPQGRPKMKEESTPSKKQLEFTETTVKGPFAFSSLPGDLGRKNNYTEELFLSAFARKRENAGLHSFGSSADFPRMVVAGAKAPFFAFRMRESGQPKSTFALGEVQKWKADSSFWAHRMKRKAAVSWSRHGLQK